MLAGYSKVKNLCFWGTSIGDGGLYALADLLQVSWHCRHRIISMDGWLEPESFLLLPQSAGSPWFKGSNLVLLEIICDGNEVPLEEWWGHV